MLQSEFIERTGYMPTYDEYRAIESLYYDYDGDKDAFCEYFKTHKSVLNKVREIACASFAKEREKLLHEKNKAEGETRSIKELMNRDFQSERCEWSRKAIEYESTISTLTKQLDNERKWRHDAEGERNENADKYAQALRDVESLKNALRLLKS